jgi:LysR family transcriptional regulator for metE and metH
VQIVVEATRRPLPALLEGRLDLAIVSARSGNRLVEHHPLFDDEMVAVMAPDHPLAASATLKAAQFASETVILYAIPIRSSDLVPALPASGGRDARARRPRGADGSDRRAGARGPGHRRHGALGDRARRPLRRGS